MPVMLHDSWTIHRFEAVDSTQTVAADLIARGAPHRTVVVAERQTAGYGRKGDVWRDVPGSCLLMTVIVRPVHDTGTNRYAMIASLACLDAIREMSGLAARLKWPNDVLLHERKVAGILGDATWRGMRLEALRIGVGINIAGDRAHFVARGLPNASSIAAEGAHDIDREAVFASFLAAFSRWEDASSEERASLVAAWRECVATMGRAVIATGVDGHVAMGRATGVTDDGDLIVTTEAGEATCLRATDIHSLRHAE